MSAALVCGFFFLGATVASGTLFEIDGRPAAMAAGGAFLAAALLARGADAGALFAGRPTPRWSPGAVALGLLVCAPAALGLIVSLDQEFPFAGDSAFHISVHFRTALFWLSPFGSDAAERAQFGGAPVLSIGGLLLARGAILAAALATLAILVRAGRSRLALALASAAAAAWSLADGFAFQRYPGLVYFLGVPFNLAIGALAPAETATSPRLVAFLALPVWLFALRPLIVGRAPDARGALAGFLLFWGERQIHWQSAPYLETWAMCGVLLALETLHERGRRGAALACLCVGAAACAKEQAILFLPFVWLAGAPWRAAAADGPARSDLLLAGFAAGLPLVFHASLRGGAGGARDIGGAGFEPWFWLEGMTTWAGRIPFYFAEAAFLPFAAALAGLALALARPAWRGGAFAALGGACAGLALYAIDSTEPGGYRDAFAGYYRFAAPFLPALAAGMFALADAARAKRAALALTAGLAIVQTPTAIAGVRWMAAESERRTGIEDGNGAMYVPLRALIGAAERDGALAPRAPVVVASPVRFVAAHPAAARGRDLGFVDARGFECGCSAERPGALAVYLYLQPEAARFAGLARSSGVEVAPGTRAAPGAPPEAYPACRAAFEATCRYVRTRLVDGVPTGVIGVGPR